MAIRGQSREKAIEGLRTRTEFRTSTGSFRGVEGRVDTTGWMDAEDCDRYRADDVVYTVMSYRTPIAWVVRGGRVVIPNANYSATTRQHLSYCRAYLDN